MAIIVIYEFAVQELKGTIDYYEQQRNGLGAEFSKEAFSSIERICSYPKAWIKLSKDSRRCNMRRFPYGIVYQIADNEIVIVAVMQLNRKPDYWKNRIKQF